MKKNSQNATLKIATIGIMSAVSIVLVILVHFPLFPAAPWLEYDPADVPIYITTFAMGPVAGLMITLVVSVIQGVTVSAGSGIIGIIMHILSTGSFVLVGGNIYRKKKTRTGAAIALACGAITSTIVMMGCNLFFQPIFNETGIDVVLKMMIPIIMPFNLIKATANAVITFLLYKSVKRVLNKIFT